jgi:hypothetical protein
MLGPYRYLRYSNGKWSKRKTYSRYIHLQDGTEKYRHVGKRKLVRPIFKRGAHRFSKPWKHYKRHISLTWRFNPPLGCGYSRNQLWIGLCRAWLAFIIWEQKNVIEKMQEYGRIIHNFQRELGLPLTRFDVIIGDEDEEYEDKDKADDSFRSDDYYTAWYTVKPDIHTPKTDDELLEELERPIYSEE